MMNEKKYEKEEAVVDVKSDRIIGSLYAQVVGVVVTDFDITLEFVYVSPRPGTKEANVISRITLPRVAGEELAKSITDLIAEHESKKGKKNG